MRLPALLAALALAAPTLADTPKPTPKSIDGFWEGALKLGPIELRLAFTFAKEKDRITGKMDSPDQAAFGIPIDSVTFADGKLKLEIKKIKATYAAQLSDDGTRLSGDWKQAVSLPLELKRVAKLTGLNRPQHPKRPFPYAEEDVVVNNAKAGVKLAGTLTRPKGDGPFPAVVLISGSGPQDRDETLLGHKPFLVIADHLTRKGVAVLRCDDRGIGKSTGDFGQATSADFATDIGACVAYLKGRKDIDPKRIGLIGHSEGGMIGPMVASDTKDVAFLVMLAGPGVPGDTLLLSQGQAVLKAMGADEKHLAWQRETQKKLLALAKEGADEAKMKEAFREQIDKMPESLRTTAGPYLKASEAQLKLLASPWWRFLLQFDPRTILRTVHCPVLALNGGKDVQVPAKENLEAIAKALREGGNTDVTVKEFPELNHLFQTAKTGAPNEYGRIAETFAPAALDCMTDWILKRVGERR